MKTNTRLICFVIVSLTLIFSSTAFAEVRFNGFASIRAVSIDSDTEVSPFPRYDEADGDISFKDESLFALQGSADLGEGLSATVQLMAEGVNDFDVEAEWAYITYQINDTHSINAGKLVNPIFSQSQYQKVGYAHNFARLPKAVYDDFEFDTIEGIALNSTFFFGDLLLTSQFTYGNWDGEQFVIGQFVDTSLDNILSAVFHLEGEWWNLFVGGFISEFSSEEIDQVLIEAFGSAVEAAIAGGASQQDVNNFVEYISNDGTDASYWFAGFGIDYNNILVDFEYASYVVDDTSDATNEVWYASIGYRFGQSIITVHTEDYSQEANQIGRNQISDAALLAVADSAAESSTDREFDGFGITWRYDFHPSAALKVDYFSGEDARESIGDYSIWSVGVDMVF